MLQKIVLKVFIKSSRCKTCILKAVAKLEGIITLTLDEEKSTLTVLGEVDVCLIVKELRRVKKMVTIESVGPPPDEKKEEEEKRKKKEEEEKKKKEEEEKKKKEEEQRLHAHYNSCRPGIDFILPDDPYTYNGCSIL